jgi:hypothetical protein
MMRAKLVHSERGAGLGIRRRRPLVSPPDPAASRSSGQSSCTVPSLHWITICVAGTGADAVAALKEGSVFSETGGQSGGRGRIRFERRHRCLSLAAGRAVQPRRMRIALRRPGRRERRSRNKGSEAA